MIDEPRFDPLDYVSAFNRRKWWFVVPAVLSVLVGIVLVWTLPREYQATTTIAVSAARVSSNMIGSAQLDRQERMRAVSQQLLSRPVLERTVRLEHLDQRDGSMEAAIGHVRRNISVSLPDSITGSGAPQQLSQDQKAQLDSYRVSYSDAKPEDAQRVVNRLTQMFVEENSKSREIRAQDTSEFIAAQLKSSEDRLNTLEAKLRQVKESYMGRLPEQTNANLQMVSGLQRQLESTATAMRGEQDRLSMVERQLDALQKGADDAAALAAGTPAETAQNRVGTLRRQLADAQLVFTAKHPEVVRLKEELATAERAAEAERARPESDRVTALQSSPEYRQLVKDRDTTKLRVAELQRQQRQITGAIANYQARVEEAPRVEQEMVSLQREYDGEQFSVLVPAGRPTEPFKPKPLRVMLMAIAAGLVLGAGGVMGREYLDRSVHDARGLRDEFELPVLAEIPRIEPLVS